MVPRSARVGGDIRKKAGRDLDDDFKVIWIWGGNVRKFRRTLPGSGYHRPRDRVSQPTMRRGQRG